LTGGRAQRMRQTRPAALTRQPVAWVLVQAVVIAAFLQATGQFEARLNPDSASYREMPFGSLAAALSHTRTFVYPAFLRFVRVVAGDDLAAPYFQFAAYVAAAAGFCFALRSVGFSRQTGGAAASALLYSRVTFEQTGDVVADVLAAALAIAAVSLLLIVVERPRSAAAWVGLTGALFLTYQARPAYLFLVPLVPLVGFALSAFVHRRRIRSYSCFGLSLLLAASTVLPLLAFCALRWSVVGHFGLVSFGGYNLIGISGQFLDDELAEEVSPEVRPLARRIIERRALVENWRPPSDYRVMEEMYNPTVWTLTVPAAEELYGKDAVRINRLVTKLSREVIRLRPRTYLRWLVWSGREGARSLLYLFITDRAARLCLLALLGSQVWVVWRRFRFGTLPALPPASDRPFVEFNTLLWLALAFAAAKVLLVILVEIPIGRYLSAAVLFAPSAFAVLTWYRLAAVFGLAESSASTEPRLLRSGRASSMRRTAP
jgi:hypothetical protein